MGVVGWRIQHFEVCPLVARAGEEVHMASCVGQPPSSEVASDGGLAASGVSKQQQRTGIAGVEPGDLAVEGGTDTHVHGWEGNALPPGFGHHPTDVRTSPDRDHCGDLVETVVVAVVFATPDDETTGFPPRSNDAVGSAQVIEPAGVWMLVKPTQP